MSAPAAAPAKKAKAPKPKAPSNHPPVIDMVKAAILAAKDRKGTSLPTIKKYIAANYKFDVEKLASHIRRGIVHAVEKGILVRVGNKGKGASGSFKVAEKKTAEHKPKPKPKAKKSAAPKAAKSPAPKKPKAKKASKPKAKAPAKPKAAKKPKVKKAATPKKPKTPKKTAAKKAAPKKK